MTPPADERIIHEYPLLFSPLAVPTIRYLRLPGITYLWREPELALHFHRAGTRPDAEFRPSALRHVMEKTANVGDMTATTFYLLFVKFLL